MAQPSITDLREEIRGLRQQHQEELEGLEIYFESQLISLRKRIKALESSSFAQSSQELQPSRQSSSFKKPQPRICTRCSIEFPSGQALFRHLPDCQPFRCTKCNSTFQSNTILHKHIRGCRHTKVKG